MPVHVLPDLDPAVAAGEARAAAVADAVAGRQVELPLRYWRQGAHFTTPAADESMARKAIESGTQPMVRILERFAVTPTELADRLDVDVARVERLLEHPARAPLVMLDGEDAQALREDVTEAGIRSAATLLANADWTGGGAPTLRFFRPPGLQLGTTTRDLYRLLWSLAERVARDGGARAAFPLDGIIFPKVEHPEEVDLVNELLDRAEGLLGLPSRSIRVGYLIESGWAAASLRGIAERAAPRLCALIFGLADYSADLRLPAIENDHPVTDWARAEIVNVAGAVGVPAIDGMTLAYPVADPSADAATNRQRFLARMRLVHDDALRARRFGMTGKWVGHPAQLFATLLAFDASLDEETLEAEAAKLEAYRVAVEDQARGATIIGGVMSDRATDRHARAVLRQAVASGRFDAERAAALGVISGDEAAEFVRTRRAQRG